jgi:TRAP-type C4-dicarboxylate transport system permease small subunit
MGLGVKPVRNEAIDRAIGWVLTAVLVLLVIAVFVNVIIGLSN